MSHFKGVLKLLMAFVVAVAPAKVYADEVIRLGLLPFSDL